MDTENQKTKTKRPIGKRLLRWALWLVLCPVLLVMLLCVLVYLPPVQDWAVGIATKKLSEMTGKKVSIERLRITPLLDIDLVNLLILNPNRLTDSDLQLTFSDRDNLLHPDTIVYAQSCVVDLDLGKLFSQQIEVEAFDLRQARVDTQDLLDELVVDGRLNRFKFDVHDVNLKSHRVNVNQITLDACDVDIALRDTVVVKEDSTSTPSPWRLNFSNVSINDSRVAFHTVRDSMAIHAIIRALALDEGQVNLDRQLVTANDFTADIARLAYDWNYMEKQEAFDVNHLLLTDVALDLDDLTYDMESGSLKTRLDELKAKERCGFELTHMEGEVEMDSTRLFIPDAILRTPSSYVHASADMEWTALKPQKNGKMEAFLYTDLSKQDVLTLVGDRLPAGIAENYPDKMLSAELRLTGNVDAIQLQKLTLKMPEMMEVSMAGEAGNLQDMSLLDADVHLVGQTWDLSLVQQILGLNGFRIPALQFTGDTHIHQDDYTVKGDLIQGRGKLNIDAHYNQPNDSYEARLGANRLTVSHFVPMDSTLCLTAKANVRGRGTDLLSKRSSLRALVDVSQLNYGRHDLRNIHLDGQLNKGHGTVNFLCNNEILDADGCIDIAVDGQQIEDAQFSLDMRSINLYSLGVTEKPLSLSMALHANGSTDLKAHHWLDGNVEGITLQTADSTYYPKDIRTELLIQPDTLFAFLSAGDLNLRLNSHQGVEQVVEGVTNYWNELHHQITEKAFDQSRLRRCLPNVDLCVESGRQNPLANISAMMTGYTFQELDIDLHTDTLSGINGHGWIHSVNTGAVMLDTIQFNMSPSQGGMALDARVCNNKRNPDITFDARLKASLSPHHASFGLVYYDDRGRKGVDLGAQATFHNHTIRVHLEPLRPILAYRYFTLNEDNYIFADSLGRIDANLDLLADDGTGLKIFSTPNEDAEQDITVSVNHFNLGELCSVLPYMPTITGYLQGDAHLLKTAGILSVGTDMRVKDMTYEGCPMGDIGINAAYMPNEDGSHYVDGFLTQNDDEVLTFAGKYKGKGEGESDNLNADVNLTRFPLATLNGFLNEMVMLSGFFNGEIHVDGPTAKPRINGNILTEQMHLLSPNYSVDLRVPDDTISVTHNRMDLSRLKAYATGTRPLQLGGYVDFTDFDRIRMDVSANARNFELINAQKNRKAEVYGKVFVDLNILVRGLLDNLNVTGNLAVLGNTDVTYVLKDSPITVEDEMADLVTFVDFSDTLDVDRAPVETTSTPANLNMRLGISIDQATQLHCLLSEDGMNYANIEGGGDLTMTYDERRGLQLHGRYTILQGRMNYTMMVMTLKDCDIANGSYVDFNGDPFNPRLSIAASERLNTTITENDTPRSVSFNVGLNISKTLNDMGLEFTLEALDDMNIQNEIAQMTPEQRGRVAVTLMATGMYIVEGKSTGGFNTTNALNSFLNTQINQIAGKALNSVDLSLGVQNTNTASGNITTDYSFRFAKRFWGNRISLIVGGKVSSGAEAENTGLSIIDNVSIEYRLDKSATRYVNVYYDNNYESILEGRVTEMGAGLVLRRKTTRLGELFIFRNKEEKAARKEKKGGKE